MQTSNFSRSGKEPNAVAICAFLPHWLPKGSVKRYTPLAPNPDHLKAYKAGKMPGDEYDRHYLEHLAQLDAQTVYNELKAIAGPDAILLCWCGKGKGCHRLLAAEWLRQELGVVVDER